MQIKNRTGSRRLPAFNFTAREKELVEVFNGEIGFATRMPLDAKKRNPRRFQVKFVGKEHLGVGYGKDVPTPKYDRKVSIEENLELAYAISIHKAQGSEFDRTYVIIPDTNSLSVSTELFYTALTRATKHCTLLVQNSVAPLLRARRPENARLRQISSSLFTFRHADDMFLRARGWFEKGKKHEALTGDMVRSKSELVIANMLKERGISFAYEDPLFAPDGTMYLPDFTISIRGEKWYWEHLGLLDLSSYRSQWDEKKAWYDRHFPGQLITTEESATLSKDAASLIENLVRL